MHQLEQRMSFLEGIYEQVNQRLSSIDAHLDSLDRKFTGETGRLDTKIDHGFASLNEKIDHGLASLNEKIERATAGLNEKIDRATAGLNEKIDRRFMWTAGVMLGGFLTTILTVVFHH